ncbi:MAG: ribosome recycling factor [Deltaproteobacteria bacterium]|nr:ribosome recycling factor [Deltaproteobacteria bacterium]
MKAILTETKRKMSMAVEVLGTEFGKLRTGRASISILDGVSIDYYGAPTPLNQLATLSVPESQVITIQPFDAGQLADIEKAIVATGLGLTPNNDGKLIRINIPQLTEERRKEFVKLAKKNAEDGRIAIRNCRRDANDSLKKLEKDKEISQDELKKAQADVQEITDAEIKRVDEALAVKEAEIMAV